MGIPWEADDAKGLIVYDVPGLVLSIHFLFLFFWGGGMG